MPVNVWRYALGCQHQGAPSTGKLDDFHIGALTKRNLLSWKAAPASGKSERFGWL
jgi:hypothetical protein